MTERNFKVVNNSIDSAQKISSKRDFVCKIKLGRNDKKNKVDRFLELAKNSGLGLSWKYLIIWLVVVYFSRFHTILIKIVLNFKLSRKSTEICKKIHQVYKFYLTRIKVNPS